MKIILRNTKLEFQVDSFNVDDYIEIQSTLENPEFKSLITDYSNKVLWGRYIDDTVTDIDLTGYTIDGAPLTRIINEIITKYNL